uniref:Uncharacterized protein n=1 Tax=Candidatus Kentrum sp. TUN TaxID=2126343 RepID=A0A451AJM7_9GAMM|nr:MAG: hypothetical protein BECKTUN1418D_GA0071000_103723 [Candidatus Kentron sp. TUN]VFK63843.1 MAG: hypothetical protein BECKTUN1418F_GA0071002_14251 [Candidatus Kentron sp. TUN]VFK66225.1 MAG: hypothetical protein BECKTUN1418D_GA0071000_14562 [Candidatus Kentron sp. TUN]VFK72493.1 MAG: hypothetical protein BECKTUN1418E_GA0071001_14271 [Candidatus Kentron sp. TUN]
MAKKQLPVGLGASANMFSMAATVSQNAPGNEELTNRGRIWLFSGVTGEASASNL